MALMAVLTIGLYAALPAAAITGGTINSNGTYSNVGMIAYYDAEGRWRCSATLVTPTVLLTAAHCTHGTVGRTIVSFKLLTDDAAPSDVPRAPDDNATPPTGTSKTGYTTGQSLPTGWYRGTASTHPSLHRRGGSEAHAADPADQRQRARHPRRWRLCFGDSGGPSFKNGYVVTVTSYGYTSGCRYLGGLQRVDNPDVQEWLADFGVFPAGI